MPETCKRGLLALGLAAGLATGATAATPIVLSDDGGWCWFQDPRAIVHRNWLIIGSVANGARDEARAGDIEALVYDLERGTTQRVELHHRLEADDHAAPALLARPDGRILAVWSRHSVDEKLLSRISALDDPTQWGSLREYVPSPSSRVTYANLFSLSSEGGRIYNFFRGLDNSFKPSYAVSDDSGETWRRGNVVINVPTEERHRPYARYASNGRDAIHVIYTEGHPRDYDNSLYHVYYQKGELHSSDGKTLAKLTDGLKQPEQGTRIFKGDAQNVAWVCDVKLDAEGRPRVAYSVQIGSAGLPRGQGGDDLRYRFARWDGHEWQDEPLAFAGTKLYAGEDDYTGLATLDPRDPDVVYISTDADPATGQPLISRADTKRHWEIFRGLRRTRGQGWDWTSITRDSAVDNLRPIVPDDPKRRGILLWLRGRYGSYTRYQLEIVGLLGS
jgi:hypothetical protein